MVSEGRGGGGTAGLVATLLLPLEAVFTAKFSGTQGKGVGLSPYGERGGSCEAGR